MIGQVFAPVRRHHLDPHHVRAPGAGRGLLGEAGRDQSGALSLGRADVGCAGARRSRDRAAALQRIYPKKKDGAPIEIFFPPEGAPINPYASGIPKTATHPNAAKLFLNWCLSKEGQTFMIKELGNLTSLKKAPVYPEGLRSQGGQGLGAEFRPVREAARRLDRGMEQDLRLSPVSGADEADEP